PDAPAVLTWMVTTEGPAVAAIAVTRVALSGSLMVIAGGGATTPGLAGWLVPTAQIATPAPDTPPTRAAQTRAATTGTLTPAAARGWERVSPGLGVVVR